MSRERLVHVAAFVFKRLTYPACHVRIFTPGTLVSQMHNRRKKPTQTRKIDLLFRPSHSP